MGNRSSYRTRQREEILDFLKCREGSHVTAAGLHEEMNRAGIRIGLTTVYRTLDKLADVKYYLHRHDIEAVDYSEKTESYFDVMPSSRPGTLRPALVRNGKLLKKGLAAR